MCCNLPYPNSLVYYSRRSLLFSVCGFLFVLLSLENTTKYIYICYNFPGSYSLLYLFVLFMCLDIEIVFVYVSVFTLTLLAAQIA